MSSENDLHFLEVGWPQETQKKTHQGSGNMRQNSSELKIVNLLKKDLTGDEIKILNHGLKFTPTPRCDKKYLKIDTEEFRRKLCLRDFFFKMTKLKLIHNKRGLKASSS